MRPHAAGAPLHEAGARMVLTAARPWFGQQVGVRVLGLRALGAGEDAPTANMVAEEEIHEGLGSGID